MQHLFTPKNGLFFRAVAATVLLGTGRVLHGAAQLPSQLQLVRIPVPA